MWEMIMACTGGNDCCYNNLVSSAVGIRGSLSYSFHIMQFMCFHYLKNIA